MTLIFIFIAENSYGALNGPTLETEIRPVADTSRTISLGGGNVNNDAFQRPTGIAFSNDGKKFLLQTNCINEMVKSVLEHSICLLHMI